MPRIEIRTPDGRAEVRKLSRRNPIVVGRNPISDVHVEDESVAPIHCRVSWNGKAFEVAAVAADGIDVNGVLVRRKELAAGDVIRVGEIDLVLLNGSDE
ncbi:MAG TPA: FHA domain-containing protein, partial [Planctomycetaceae bacterium]